MKNLSFNNKKNKVLLLFTMVIGLSSCFNNGETLKETTDPNVINGLQSVDLTYRLNDSGVEQPFYCLWDGPKPGPVVQPYSTFLTDYHEIEEEFYLVYLKKEVIESNRQQIKKFEEKNNAADNVYDMSNYHFSSYKDDNIIDGKHYFAFKRANKIAPNDIKYYVAKDLRDIKFQIDDFQLTMCAKRKGATILESVSYNRNNTINKDIQIYNRYELIFKNNWSSPTFYEFEGFEKYNQKKLSDIFELQGLRIDAFKDEYDNETIFSCPRVGIRSDFLIGSGAQVIKEDGRELIVLPRYIRYPDINDNPDLFSYNSSDPLLNVFGGHKKVFQKAFIGLSDEYSPRFIMGFYDYKQVVKIIY